MLVYLDEVMIMPKFLLSFDLILVFKIPFKIPYEITNFTLQVDEYLSITLTFELFLQNLKIHRNSVKTTPLQALASHISITTKASHVF